MESEIPTTENETALEEERRTRKRMNRKSLWKKNVAKRLKNQGKAYVSSTTGKNMKAKELLPPCNERCKLKCTSNFSDEARLNIFENYWALGDVNRQRDYLSSCMVNIKPKYQYHVHESKRRDNNAFYFTYNNNRIRVCKSFFKATLSITDRPIRTVIEKRTESATVLTDLRGKHENHKKLEESIREGIKNHINSIPRIESHYTRARSSREYIEGGKSLADLHRDYVEECKTKNVSHGKYLMYHKIFNEEFNISFFSPKKDQCATCATYVNASDSEKERLKDVYENHISEKDLSRNEKQIDKEKVNENYVVACFDLQAVLQCPRGDISVFYYLSKLNVFNFTVYECKKKPKSDNCICYVWDETRGKRGANEIGSCLLKYLEERSSKNTSGELEFVFYSDNCIGQQKNRFIITMFMYAVTKCNIKSITHKFLIAGHTQNEGDSAHSVIERQIKQFLKSGPIYVPEQYVSLIRTAKKTGTPYMVKELSHTDFFDLKSLNSQVGSFLADDKISDMKIIKIEKSNPYTIFYKTSYSQNEFLETRLRSPRNKQQIELNSPYQTRLKISERKKCDLLELLRKNHIPSYYEQFYKNL